MKQQLQLIFELNQLDLRVDDCQAQLEKIPERLAELELEVQTQKMSLEEKTNQIAELEKTKRGREGEVELAESRLKEFQLKLSQIKTNKEYQAALKEITETKKANKVIEDQILEIMTRVDQFKQEKTTVEASLTTAVAAFEKEKVSLEAEEKKLREAVLEIEKAKKALLESIEEKIYGQYQKIKKVRRDAVTFVDSGACQGCHMHIPPQLVIEIQKSKGMHCCPSCHRILYLREWQDGQSGKINSGRELHET